MRKVGVTKFYRPADDYGFIVCEGMERDIYFSSHSMHDPRELEWLNTLGGDAVELEVVQNSKIPGRFRASAVELVRRHNAPAGLTSSSG